MPGRIATLGSLVAIAFAYGACLSVSDAPTQHDAGSDAAGGTVSGGGSGGSLGGSSGSGATGGTEAGPPGKLGDPCSVDVDCESGTFCSPPLLHGATGSQKLCVRGCCSSSECENDEVCYAATGGYGICLPTAAAGRPAVGTAAQGAPCTKDDDCRSAMCSNGACLDICCTDSDCTSNDACALRQDPTTQRIAFFCGQPAGAGAFGASCQTGSDCRSGSCLGNHECSESCCSKADCGGTVAFGCTYITGYPRVCAPVLPSAGATGTACNNNTDCQTGWCVKTGTTGICSDTCCSDADCGDPNAYACRALQSGTSAVLVCLKR